MDFLFQPEGLISFLRGKREREVGGGGGGGAEEMGRHQSCILISI